MAFVGKKQISETIYGPLREFQVSLCGHLCGLVEAALELHRRRLQSSCSPASLKTCQRCWKLWSRWRPILLFKWRRGCITSGPWIRGCVGIFQILKFLKIEAFHFVREIESMTMALEKVDAKWKLRAKAEKVLEADPKPETGVARPGPETENIDHPNALLQRKAL